MENEALKKIFIMIDMMARPQGGEIEEMLERIEASRQTVYRNVDLMEQMGFQIDKDTRLNSNRVFFTIPPETLKKVGSINFPAGYFTQKEQLLLSYLFNSNETMQSPVFETLLSGLKNKIFEGSQNKIKLGKVVNKIDQVFVKSTTFRKDYSSFSSIIEDLAVASIANKKCRLKYHIFYNDTEKDFEVDPLHLLEVDGGLYLICRISDEKIIVLAVERIKSLELTETTFIYPIEFNPQDYADSAFRIFHGKEVKVKIRFTPDQARYVEERKWANDQEIKKDKKGFITLSFTTSGIYEVKRWILSWGQAAEALEPEELVEEIKAEIKALQNTYK
jgi:predicted DNA-binding transcriptional regulator YafY